MDESWINQNEATRFVWRHDDREAVPAPPSGKGGRWILLSAVEYEIVLLAWRM